MTLFQGPGSNPRTAARYVDLLRAYGAIGDRALGETAGFCARKAAIAVSLSDVAGSDASERSALYFAGTLHAIGALGNAGVRAGTGLSPREAAVARWDVPADGARACAAVRALPSATADIVRWQFESWDGTGFPDQLRWQSIPSGAQLLRLADAVARAGDPYETMTQVASLRGRDVGPEPARVFTAWFAQTSGAFPAASPPELHDVADDDCAALLDRIAERVDAHAETPQRWQRVAQIADGAAAALNISAYKREALAIAARLFASGDVDAADAAHVDPLVRIGIERRARSAREASRIVEDLPTLADVAPILAARSEWYDGTGAPLGIARDAIPPEARILSAAIACEALERSRHPRVRGTPVSPEQRLEDAAGTHFDPDVVRAVVAVARGTRA